MSGYFIQREDMERINNALNGYFEKRHSIPDAVAMEWASMPDYRQIPLYELCVSYLQRLANEDNVRDSTLQAYQNVAKIMIETIEY